MNLELFPEAGADTGGKMMTEADFERLVADVRTSVVNGMTGMTAVRLAVESVPNTNKFEREALSDRLMMVLVEDAMERARVRTAQNPPPPEPPHPPLSHTIPRPATRTVRTTPPSTPRVDWKSRQAGDRDED